MSERKEAILAILSIGDFFGEGCLASQPLCMATAAAVTECSVMRLEKSAMIAALNDEPVFSALFISYLLLVGGGTSLLSEATIRVTGAS